MHLLTGMTEGDILVVPIYASDNQQVATIVHNIRNLFRNIPGSKVYNCISWSLTVHDINSYIVS